MSLLSEKTEKEALILLARSLKPIQHLNSTWMSADDAYQITCAENLIRSVIEKNGYRILSGKGNGVRLKKIGRL